VTLEDRAIGLEAPFQVSLRCFILEPSCFKAGSSLLTKAELPGFFVFLGQANRCFVVSLVFP